MFQYIVLDLRVGCPILKFGHIHIFQRELNPNLFRVDLALGKQDNRLHAPSPCSQRSGPDCENNIIKHMNQAKSVDIVVYSISNPAIVDSILAAHKRGAKVRVITDRTQAKGKGSLVGKIRDAGIPVVTNIKHKIEHNKFAVFDGKHVVSGSYNWTTNASKYNSENCTFFDQPDKEYSERFKYLWDLYKK